MITGPRIVDDLTNLGLDTKAIVIVHCSLSSLGRVIGGEQTVLLALRRAVGSAGTIVVPAQSWQLCDPAYLNDPAVPPESWGQIRSSLPSYDPHGTPSRGMGLLAEAVRTHPDSIRSGHPHRSFAGWGPAATHVMARHRLDDPVGEGSPLKALYDLGAVVLLLGVDYSKCTALHLAESRSGAEVERVANGAPMRVGGQRQWVEFTEPLVDDSDFAEVGRAFEAACPEVVQIGRVGLAKSRLVPMGALVDFSADWMAHNRSSVGQG